MTELRFQCSFSQLQHSCSCYCMWTVQASTEWTEHGRVLKEKNVSSRKWLREKALKCASLGVEDKLGGGAPSKAKDKDSLDWVWPWPLDGTVVCQGAAGHRRQAEIHLLGGWWDLLGSRLLGQQGVCHRVSLWPRWLLCCRNKKKDTGTRKKSPFHQQCPSSACCWQNLPLWQGAKEKCFESPAPATQSR